MNLSGTSPITEKKKSFICKAETPTSQAVPEKPMQIQSVSLNYIFHIPLKLKL